MRILAAFMLAPLIGALAVGAPVALISGSLQFMGTFFVLALLYGYPIVFILGVPAYFTLRSLNMLQLRHCIIFGSSAGLVVPLIITGVSLVGGTPELQNRELLLSLISMNALGLVIGAVSAWFFWAIGLRKSQLAEAR